METRLKNFVGRGEIRQINLSFSFSSKFSLGGVTCIRTLCKLLCLERQEVLAVEPVGHPQLSHFTGAL